MMISFNEDCFKKCFKSLPTRDSNMNSHVFDKDKESNVMHSNKNKNTDMNMNMNKFQNNHNIDSYDISDVN